MALSDISAFYARRLQAMKDAEEAAKGNTQHTPPKYSYSFKNRQQAETYLRFLAVHSSMYSSKETFSRAVVLAIKRAQSKHHPDKNGNADLFHEVRLAKRFFVREGVLNR